AHVAVAGEPVTAAERKQHPGQRQRRGERRRERQRHHLHGEQVKAVGGHRPGAEQAQLPRRQPEGEPVLELDVGGQANAPLAHSRHAAAASAMSGSLAQYAIRARAISTYSASRSIPKKRKPSSRQAIPVVPEPANGSSTSPPGGVTSRTSQRISATGFTVGCVL